MTQLTTFKEFKIIQDAVQEYENTIPLLAVGKAIELALEFIQKNDIYKINSWITKYPEENKDLICVSIYKNNILNCPEKISSSKNSSIMSPLHLHLKEWENVIYDFACENFGEPHEWRFEAKQEDNVEGILCKYMNQEISAKYLEAKLKNHAATKPTVSEDNSLGKWMAEKDIMTIKIFEGLHLLFQKTLHEHHLEEVHLWTGKAVGEAQNWETKDTAVSYLFKNNNTIQYADFNISNYEKSLKQIDRYFLDYGFIIKEQIMLRIQENENNGKQINLDIKSDSPAINTLSTFLPQKLLKIATEQKLHNLVTRQTLKNKSKI